jgi:acyl-CoA thioester hydrolase
MKPPSIELRKVAALELFCLRITVPEAYADANGHMNMRWYPAIFDDAGDVLHERLGLTPEFHRRNQTGTVDLEHHVHYLAEAMPGDRVAVYARLLGHTAKRLHYQMFMVNETTDRLASIFECMNAFLDLRVRRTAPFPPAIAEKIAEGVAQGAALDWEPPVCGAMRP